MSGHDGPSRVLALVGDPGNGVAYVRFIQPFSRLADAGFELVLPPAEMELVRGRHGWQPAPSLLDGVSILMFPQMVLSPVLGDGTRLRAVEPLCEEARRRGIPIVYSPDDYLEHIEPDNPSYEIVSDSARNIRTLLESADALIVTTEQLRTTLAPWGKPTRVVPNAVDPRVWSRRPAASGELRIGWAGSSSHLEDLRPLLAATRTLQRRMDVRLCVLGLVDEPLDAAARGVRGLLPRLPDTQRGRAELFLEVAAELASLDHLHRPFTTLDAYFRELPALDVDVAVCPLLDTPFNRHKSAIKFYEYAAAGSMTVASAVPPYSDEVSVTVDNDPAAWAEVLETHLRDPERRERELRSQRDFVLRERNIETLRFRWAEALRSVLAGSAVPPARV